MGSDDGKIRVWQASEDGRLDQGMTLTNPGGTNVRFVAFNATSDCW